MFERITADGKTLAYLVRAEADPEETTFITPPELNLQAGFVVYPAGGEVASHVHLPLERSIVGTCEVLLVREGRCEVDIYDEARQLAATRELKAGDMILLAGGGHGLRMSEDTVLLEIKQGPYLEKNEKDRF
jgi:hypothetical protein